MNKKSKRLTEKQKRNEAKKAKYSSMKGPKRNRGRKRKK